MAGRFVFSMVAAVTVLLLAMVPCSLASGNAGSVEDDPVKALIMLLEAKGVISQDEGKQLIEQFSRRKQPSTGKKVIMVIPDEKEEEYVARVTDRVNRQIKQDLDTIQKEVSRVREDYRLYTAKDEKRQKEMEQDVQEVNRRLARTSWAERLRWGGDMRLRYQGDFFPSGNADFAKPSDPDKVLNTESDRHRFRYRVRLKVKADIWNQDEGAPGSLQAGIRLATGNEHDPVSTNDTLGDYYNKDNFLVDRAYLKWSYLFDQEWGLGRPAIEVSGGKIPNPFFHTDLVWDSDLNFEGVALKLNANQDVTSPWDIFVTLGGFPLQELELYQRDKWLYGGQAGIAYNQEGAFSARLGVAMYEYENIKGEPVDPSVASVSSKYWSAPLYQQKGNILVDLDPTTDYRLGLASDFSLLNITGQVDVGFWAPVYVSLFGDYVRNMDFDEKRIRRLLQSAGNLQADYAVDSEADEGYLVGIKVGHRKMRQFGDWKLSLYYKYLEADAVVDAFTDSDFHLGGTNAKGWVVQGEMGVYTNCWLALKWITSDEVDGPPLSVDSVFLDFNARY